MSTSADRREQQGMKRNTVMRVVTDGDDGLRNFVQRSSPRPMESGERSSSSRGCAQTSTDGRRGTRISTAHVESAMNHLVNHRLNKKQQMRWSPEGPIICCKSAPNS
jgi:hypothetical protein